MTLVHHVVALVTIPTLNLHKTLCSPFSTPLAPHMRLDSPPLPPPNVHSHHLATFLDLGVTSRSTSASAMLGHFNQGATLTMNLEGLKLCKMVQTYFESAFDEWVNLS